MPAMNRPLIIETPGLMTTVQDLGRVGYRQYGVPVSGAMDREALIAANRRVGNPDDAAGLEITLTGPSLRFSTETPFAVTGATFQMTLDGIAIEPDQSHTATAGSRLVFGERISGCRAYLAIAGGIDVPEVMSSRSTYLPAQFGGYEGRALKAGDVLPIGNLRATTLRAGPIAPLAREVIRVLPGPEIEDFEMEALRHLLTSPYRIAPESNRIGYRLNGAPLRRRSAAREMVSSATVMGTIQVPPNGQPIVLMADAPTVGGYPRIAVVMKADCGLLAQLKPDDDIRFEDAARLILPKNTL